MALVGIAGDDSASCSLAFCSVFGKKFSDSARRYNAVTLNDMLFCPLPESSLRGWRV